MIFRICRTSSLDSECKPCEGAIPVTIPSVIYWPGRMKTTRTAWNIEINTLEELIALQNILEEDLILLKPVNGEDPSIEIYDGYRE